jgi:hypothetical protein
VVSDAIPLPTHFEVRIRGKTSSAEVRWRNGQQIGIKFFVEETAEAEKSAYQTARDLHDARMENKWLKGREKALLKRLAELGFVEADGF